MRGVRVGSHRLRLWLLISSSEECCKKSQRGLLVEYFTVDKNVRLHSRNTLEDDGCNNKNIKTNNCHMNNKNVLSGPNLITKLRE
jgi:hypothetical protein